MDRVDLSDVNYLDLDTKLVEAINYFSNTMGRGIKEILEATLADSLLVELHKKQTKQVRTRKPKKRKKRGR